MGRRDLDASGAELRVYVFVGNDGDAAAGQRQFHKLAKEVFVAFVPWVNGDGAVAEHGLRAGSGDD